MKRIILCAAIFLTAAISKPTFSQIRLSINANIGSQPSWGPVGYDHVDYYYLPDMDMYYYVPSQQFIYLSNGHWIFSINRPVQYRNYDLYNGYKVVINEPKAYLYYGEHKVKYSGYRGNHGSQVIIRNSNEPKYYIVKGHPKYNNRAKGSNIGNKQNRGQSKANGHNKQHH